MKVDMAVIDKYVSDKLITKRPNENKTLFILNYTPRTQYTNTWDDITMLCRGLIVNTAGTVVGKSFTKFFELDAHPTSMGPNLPKKPFVVTEKEDGSLIVVGKYDDEIFVSSRGSFDSPQAIWARTYIQRNYGFEWIQSGLSYCFEGIYPDNRIIVDYGKAERLPLLAIFQELYDGTWIELPREHYGRRFVPDKMEVVKQYKFNTWTECIEHCSKLDGTKSEGLVISWPEEDVRVKLKGQDYKSLFKVLKILNSDLIWERLWDNYNDPTKKVIPDNLPPDATAWAKQVQESITTSFWSKMKEVESVYSNEIVGLPDRKTQAAYILKHHPTISAPLFALASGSSAKAEQSIYKHIKPDKKQFLKGEWTDDAA